MAIKNGLDQNDLPKPGDIALITQHYSIQGGNLHDTTECFFSINGSKPSVSLFGGNFGNVVAHALPPNPDGTYETTNAAIVASRSRVNISGALIVGEIGANQQLARGNLSITNDSPNDATALGPQTYIRPQSSLSVSFAGGNSKAELVNSGHVSLLGGSADFAANVTGDGGTFDLEAYLSDPLQASTDVVTFQARVAGQSVHVGYGSQLNLGDGLATQSSSFTEDPFSQVVLRGTQTTGFTYQNGMLDVRNGTVQVADLKIAPTGGANGFSITQIGADAVISAVALTTQQIAQAFIGTPVLHYGS